MPKYWNSSKALAPVLLDLALEIGVFLARQEADPSQRRQVFFCFGQVSANEIRLAEVLVDAAVPRVQRERLFVVAESRIELSGIAVGVAQIVLEIGVAAIA